MRRLGEALRLAETEGIPWDPTPLKRVKHAPKAENRRVIFDRFAVDAIRLLLLTGCRLREILELRWSEVDLERGLLAPLRFKNWEEDDPAWSISC